MTDSPRAISLRSSPEDFGQGCVEDISGENRHPPRKKKEKRKSSARARARLGPRPFGRVTTPPIRRDWHRGEICTAVRAECHLTGKALGRHGAAVPIEAGGGPQPNSKMSASRPPRHSDGLIDLGVASATCSPAGDVKWPQDCMRSFFCQLRSSQREPRGFIRRWGQTSRRNTLGHRQATDERLLA